MVRRLRPLLRGFAGVLMLALAPIACGQAVPLDEAAAPIDAPFGPRQVLGPLANDAITEASGLVASRRQPGVFWTHNDSGDGPRLFAFDRQGRHLGTYTLAGIRARDWEDLALGPGPEPGADYLYVGDVGDNQARRPAVSVLRLPEPAVSRTGPAPDTTLAAERFALRYPDGPRDAEVLMVDPLSRDLLILSKEATPRLYAFPIPMATIPDGEAAPHPLRFVQTLTLPLPDSAAAIGHLPTAGDVRADGLEALIKTYGRVYRWSRADASRPLFASSPEPVPYVLEVQGEALALTPEGYYSVSEERAGIPAVLSFYPRQAGGE